MKYPETRLKSLTTSHQALVITQQRLVLKRRKNRQTVRLMNQEFDRDFWRIEVEVQETSRAIREEVMGLQAILARRPNKKN